MYQIRSSTQPLPNYKKNIICAYFYENFSLSKTAGPEDYLTEITTKKTFSQKQLTHLGTHLKGRVIGCQLSDTVDTLVLIAFGNSSCTHSSLSTHVVLSKLY